MTRITTARFPGMTLGQALLAALLSLALLAVPCLAQDSPGTDDINRTTPPRDDPTTVTQVVPPVAPSQPPTTGTTAGNPNPDRGDTTVDADDDSTTNPGDFAEDLVRAEAIRSLPPPLSVVRLDDPAFVFSGLDPDVTAGVAAWRGTLKGPTDQYGTFKGPGYKGSYRPDSVNGQLVTFLADFLKGKRLVAISDGQASSLSTLQDTNRAAAVEEFVNRRREEASAAATPPGTNSTNTTEDVPNIADGSDSTDGSGSTTQTADSNPGSGSTTSTGDGNTTTGSANADAQTEAALESKFPGITIEKEPKAFTASELGMMDDTLSKLPPAFFKDTTFRRTSTISIDGSPDPDVFGVTRTRSDSDQAILELSDKSLSDNASDRIDFPSPPYPDDESKRLQFQGTLAHELTHRFLRMNPGGQFFGDVNANPFISDADTGWAGKFGWTFDPTQQTWSLAQDRKPEVPTVYAGTSSPTEDMAESVMLYLFDPQRLRAASFRRYNFIRDQFGIAEQGDANVSFPPPREDPRLRQAKVAAN